MKISSGQYFDKMKNLPLKFSDLQGSRPQTVRENYTFPQDGVILMDVQFVEGQTETRANIIFLSGPSFHIYPFKYMLHTFKHYLCFCFDYSASNL